MSRRDTALAEAARARNVRPRSGDGAAGRCPWPAPNALGRPQLFCPACRFERRTGDHCHLFEMCDGCTDEANPCQTAQSVAAEVATWPEARSEV